MELQEFFEKNSDVAVAFSGGVDSAYLLYMATCCAKSVKAYYVRTAFQPQFELDDAIRLADELGVQMRIIELDVLNDETVRSNPCNRCYYCKKLIFSAIKDAAREDGFTVVLDGTNASDDAADRPGMKALEEMMVLSPLRICDLSKSRIRDLSKAAGLFTWDKPAYACLATRIPAGTAIEERMLIRTERAEAFMAELGFADFRVRTAGECAKLQIKESDLQLLFEKRETIRGRLLEEYDSVVLDLEVRG